MGAALKGYDSIDAAAAERRWCYRTRMIGSSDPR
jgi:hypothetical protein